MKPLAPLFLCLGMAMLLLAGCADEGRSFNQIDSLVPLEPAPLKRSYYRIYRASGDPRDEERCYLTPAVNGLSSLGVTCSAGDSLGEMLEKYQGCQQVPGQVPNLMRSLVSCEDAIQFVKLLHERIYQRNELPYVYETDSYALCELPECGTDSRLAEYCAYYLNRQASLLAGDSVSPIIRTFSSPTLSTAAACAMRLYR